MVTCTQEAVKLAPQRFDLLATCAKSISDATYLDEIPSSHRHYERLSSAQKREFNDRALVYAKRVRALNGSCGMTLQLFSCR